MYKLVLYLCMISFGVYLFAMQMEEQLAIQSLFRAKEAVNRAAHAAAQQIDSAALAEGRLRINRDEAMDTALHYLRMNLGLDENNHPLRDSWLKAQVRILVMEVINDDEEFPYRYMNESMGYEVTLYRPGVILVVAVEHPSVFQLLGTVRWNVKGCSELVWSI